MTSKTLKCKSNPIDANIWSDNDCTVEDQYNIPLSTKSLNTSIQFKNILSRSKRVVSHSKSLKIRMNPSKPKDSEEEFGLSLVH